MTESPTCLATQLATRNFFQRRFPCHRPQLPPLGKLSRNRYGLPAKMQVPKSAGFGPKNHLVSRKTAMTSSKTAPPSECKCHVLTDYDGSRGTKKCSAPTIIRPFRPDKNHVLSPGVEQGPSSKMLRRRRALPIGSSNVHFGGPSNARQEIPLHFSIKWRNQGRPRHRQAWRYIKPKPVAPAP